VLFLLNAMLYFRAQVKKFDKVTTTNLYHFSQKLYDPIKIVCLQGCMNNIKVRVTSIVLVITVRWWMGSNV